MPTHTTTKTWSRLDGGTRISATGSTDTADGEDNRDIVLSSSAEQRVDLAISASRIKHLWLSSTVDMTIRTNDAATGTPIDTLSLVAGHATDYSAASGATGPFSVDVTAFYVTPASAGTLYVRVLQDSTA
jgi:hypothetical protein